MALPITVTVVSRHTKLPEGDTAADVQADPKTQGKEIAQVRRARENADSAAEVKG